HEGHPVSVGGELGRQRSARPVDPGLLLTRFPVDSLDHVDDTVRVTVVLEATAGRDILAEVDVAAVGRHDRFGSVLLPVASLGNLRAAATGDMVEPHLTRTERARVAEVFPPHEVLSV